MKLKTNTYRFIALTMALLIFFSSVGFSLDLHYCQGKIKSFSLMGKAKSCYQLADASSSKDCMDHSKKIKHQKTAICAVEQQTCCTHQFLQFQLDQDQQIANSAFANQIQTQHFLIAYVTVFYKLNATVKTEATYRHYKPPLLSRDFPVLFESFLL